MDYRSFLLAISPIAMAAEFTATNIRENSYKLFPFVPDSKDWPNIVLTKTISGHLSRLYHMQILLRRKQKRLIKMKTAKSFYRGWEYVYRISKQGSQYVQYLQNPNVEKTSTFMGTADLVDMVEMKMLYDHIPESLREYAEEICRVFLSHLGKGRFRRFPKRTDPKLYFVLINVLNTNKVLEMKLELEKVKNGQLRKELEDFKGKQ